MSKLTDARHALCAAACTYSYVQGLRDEVTEQTLGDTITRIGRRLNLAIRELEIAALEYTTLVQAEL